CGLMARLWGYAGEYRLDGSLQADTNWTIAREAGWQASEDLFVDALATVGLLEVHPDGRGYVLHDFRQNTDRNARRKLARRGLRYWDGVAPPLTDCTEGERSGAIAELSRQDVRAGRNPTGPPGGSGERETKGESEAKGESHPGTCRVPRQATRQATQQATQQATRQARGQGQEEGQGQGEGPHDEANAQRDPTPSETPSGETLHWSGRWPGPEDLTQFEAVLRIECRDLPEFERIDFRRSIVLMQRKARAGGLVADDWVARCRLWMDEFNGLPLMHPRATAVTELSTEELEKERRNLAEQAEILAEARSRGVTYLEVVRERQGDAKLPKLCTEGANETRTGDVTSIGKTLKS
ncbi:hypothetical protein LCGC14_2702750, partial [marine sediment metagenome]